MMNADSAQVENTRSVQGAEPPVGLLQRYRHRYRSLVDGRHPVRSLARWPTWLLHCALKRPAIARFKTGSLRMELAPRLMHFGSTSIYIRRDNYEAELLATRRLIEPGSVVLDVGGSFGIFSLFMAHFTGPEGRVHTFEPGRFSHALLRRNAGLNPQLSQLTIHNIAAAAEPGELVLSHLGDSPVNFSISEVEGAETETVRAERVDAIVPRDEWDRVGFIKIDVEGFELEALKGMRAILEAAHPVIMFEVSHPALQRQGITAQTVYDWLADLGYRLFALDDGQFVPISAAQGDNVFASVTDLAGR